jgi:NAD(P)-dependent dehydrogenase (short-subunit alcohol dehydrogenase family)
MSDKTLIITGSTGGLGKVVVDVLSRDYRCVPLHRPDLAGEASVRAAIARAADQWGPPYGLVHLVGGYAGGKVSETSMETWREMIDLNLDKSFIVIRETLSRMRRDAPGRIVAISSQATRSRLASAAAYTIAKSGLNVLIELTAQELKGSGITANALLPGTLDTPEMRKAMPDARRVPLDRVAATISFLLSDAAASINGALIDLE